MASIKNTLMLSCKKATELIEKRDVKGLDPVQNMQLSFHLMMCKACKDYEQQSIFLDKVLSMQMQRNTQEPDKDLKLDPDLKKDIINLIHQKSKKTS